jgi:hypothetical protein
MMRLVHQLVMAGVVRCVLTKLLLRLLTPAPRVAKQLPTSQTARAMKMFRTIPQRFVTGLPTMPIWVAVVARVAAKDPLKNVRIMDTLTLTLNAKKQCCKFQLE